jgi:hypothetical protein
MKDVGWGCSCLQKNAMYKGVHVKMIIAYINKKIMTESRQHHFFTCELTVYRNLYVFKLPCIYKINCRALQENTLEWNISEYELPKS